MNACREAVSATSWSDFAQLSPEEIHEIYSVHMEYNQLIDREFLDAGNRVQFILDGMALQMQGEESIFQTPFQRAA